MIGKFFRLFVGHTYKKFIKKCQPVIVKINGLEETYQSLSDEAIVAKSEELKRRVVGGESLDDVLPEAFALVKNTARRLCGQEIEVCGHKLIWDMVHYDVQLLGGIALHQGKICEMATGEGKTLVATLPLYLNALSGKNCQLVTVNDYLASRDAEWMGYLYEFLGITVGCLQNEMDIEERQKAYACNITYGTASEFGFDYLRDNGMATSPEEQVQREHYYCIVDEVDSILIDEARTPLIISGAAPKDEEKVPYVELKPSVANLVELQQKLCNRLVSDAKAMLDDSGKDYNRDAYKKLWQVKLGMPKNKQFLRLMENGAYRKNFDRFDLEMNSELLKSERYQIKEELYYCLDEKDNQSDLTELGRAHLSDDESAFVLPDLPSIFSAIDVNDSLSPDQKIEKKRQAEEEFSQKSIKIHCLNQLLRAYSLYNRDEQYAILDGKIVIIDENTGRAMPGRRWSDGLHQAIEAKEGVKVERESRTYATVTMQNYFRMYEKLAGMTGTAETEAQEFNDIYHRPVVVIPSHKKCIRIDLNDEIYKTRREKYSAVVAEIKAANQNGQPVLVGTTSVEASELLSKMLKREMIGHKVLNAKYHQQEAEIIAQAGQRGAVTIATNMAGRGTDIKLGDGVSELGGLFVIGTERHESRRVDRQLRGRCARQGDPGCSKFFVSLEDTLMRIFASAGPIARLLQNTFKEGEVLAHPLLNRSIETAQKKVEQHYYSTRKHLLQYDDVLNQQRKVIYALRSDSLVENNAQNVIFEIIRNELDSRLEQFSDDPEENREEDDGLKMLLSWANINFPLNLKASDLANKSRDAIHELILSKIKSAYEIKQSTDDPESLKFVERMILIRTIDGNWQKHLTEMDALRSSVGLRGYGQRDPINEYRTEAFGYFDSMLRQINSDVCSQLFRSAGSAKAFNRMVHELRKHIVMSGGALEVADGSQKQPEKGNPQMVIKPTSLPKINRNDPCPCGSGKKYKKCCGLK
ncbi:MAG: preprotein translocase subunit SecA [Puniceicoccales bacterium]|jgi:preprotein translocase subunit SecA|nr:preprotein translocase subunit SecA [Puniceicoccales bacterium]